jgi:predicted component of type VI protein secretion system
LTDVLELPSRTTYWADFHPRGVYNSSMARGWESKSVEEQQAAASTQIESKQRLTPQEAAKKQERDALELSRKRVLQELESVENARHRQMLEGALADLDSKLARLV